MIFFVSDAFAEHYKGGAELTTEAIISDSYFPCNKILSSNPHLIPLMKKNSSAFWIFGNFANIPENVLLFAAKNLDYSVLEYDYKYCELRSPGKHILKNETCKCESLRKGKLISIFLNNAKSVWWMSRNQLEHYKLKFPFLDNDKNSILSSVFSSETLDYICSLDTSKKNKKYIILNSPSWIKGKEEAIEYAQRNNLDYELVWGLDYKQLLNKLARSKGIIFFPKAGDTCPRITIEAKLLDCELILNENVQHKNEPWFQTKENTLHYLRKRTEIFWSRIEKVAFTNLQIPECKDPVEQSKKFIFVVPFYNCQKWIEKCVNSIRRQNYTNFKCYLIDDISTDNSSAKIKEMIKDDQRFKLIQNKQKKYALGNIAYILNEKDLNDDDIIILIDGDDWLSSAGVLTKLNEEYKKDILVTYGSYVYNPTGQRGVEPSAYPKDVIEKNSYREDIWRASHLRTFKYHLWSKLNLDDLKENGEYYPMTYDQAIMLPMLEMSAERSLYIPEILLVYNRQNPLSVDKIKAKKQSDLAIKIRNKKPYKRI